MCSKNLAKFGLVALNVVFFLVGVVFLALGIFLLVNDSTVSKLINLIPGPGQQVTETVDVVSILKSASYALIIAGGLIFIIGFCGCCGAVMEQKLFLGVYIGMVAAILIAEVAFGVVGYLYRDKVEMKLQEFLEQRVANEYVGTTLNNGLQLPNDAISLGLDIAHIMLGCCGVTNWTNYAYLANNWNPNYNVSLGNDTYYQINASVPVTCCKMVDTSKFPDKADEIQFVDLNSCLTSPGQNNTNLEGCYEKVRDLVFQYSTIALAVIGGIVAVEILALIMACGLCTCIGKE